MPAKFRSRLSRSAGAGALALLAGLSLTGTVRAETAPPATGTARIWFYRDYEPSVSLNLAPVALNGAPAGYVQPDGSAFYRDVPAGHYHITVDSFGKDVNQAKDIDLAPGQEAFVKIQASDSWIEAGDQTSFHRDTFYVALMPPQVARAELAHRPLNGG